LIDGARINSSCGSLGVANRYDNLLLHREAVGKLKLKLIVSRVGLERFSRVYS